MQATETASYLVIETFTSIQGEGLRIGRPSTFIRLAHCNLTCAWCDTTYAWKKGEMVPPEKLSADEVAARVEAPDVVFTGGEPLLHHLAPVLDRLPGRFVTVETNATLYKPDERVGLWSLSPKLGSSGQTPDPGVIRRYVALGRERVQLKFVVGGQEDLDAVKALLAELPEVVEQQIPVIFQPVGLPGQSRDDYCARMQTLIEANLLPDAFWRAYNWRFLPQFHKLIWQDKRGI
jgi:organic radical activating enzyme